MNYWQSLPGFLSALCLCLGFGNINFNVMLFQALYFLSFAVVICDSHVDRCIHVINIIVSGFLPRVPSRVHAFDFEHMILTP